MKLFLTLLLLPLIIPGLIEAQTASGATICQSLDRKASKNQLSLTFGLMESTGEIGSIKGWIEMVPGDPSKARVTVQADLSSLIILTAGQRNVILEEAIKAANPAIITFKSSEVRKISTDRYLVIGAVIRGNVKHPASFPIRLLRYSPASTRLTGTASRSDVNLVPSFPYQFSGEVFIDLTFTQDRCQLYPFSN